MGISIVIPFYNEAKNVPLVLEAFEKLSGKYSDFELICVNDGSKDNTGGVLNEAVQNMRYPFLKVISYSPNGGYGNAIMTGVRAATGDMVAWTHSDMQTSPEDVFRAYKYFEDSADKKIIVKGRRVNRTMQQVVLSFGMAVIASTILRRKLFEINAQPKLFPKEIIPLLKDAPRDFSLDLYLLCLAQNQGYKIKTIPVKFLDRIHGESSWSASWKTKYKTVWRSIKYIWRIRKEV
jgi:glycosyltransferase involved in cell wall biosynthesis